MKINVTHGNNAFPLEVDANDTIASLKQKIQESIQLPTDMQSLYFCGRLLLDHHTISYYSIHDNCSVFLVSGITSGVASGPSLLAHGISINPSPVYSHDCSQVTAPAKVYAIPDDTTLHVPESCLWDPDTPITISFDLQKLCQFTNCLGPRSASYISTEGGASLVCCRLEPKKKEPVTHFFKQLNLVCPSELAGEMYGVRELQEAMDKKIKLDVIPEGGWMPNTLYFCYILNNDTKGVKWTFRTGPRGGANDNSMKIEPKQVSKKAVKVARPPKKEKYSEEEMEEELEEFMEEEEEPKMKKKKSKRKSQLESIRELLEDAYVPGMGSGEAKELLMEIQSILGIDTE